MNVRLGFNVEIRIQLPQMRSWSLEKNLSKWKSTEVNLHAPPHETREKEKFGKYP